MFNTCREDLHAFSAKVRRKGANLLDGSGAVKGIRAVSVQLLGPLRGQDPILIPSTP